MKWLWELWSVVPSFYAVRMRKCKKFRQCKRGCCFWVRFWGAGAGCSWSPGRSHPMVVEAPSMTHAVFGWLHGCPRGLWPKFFYVLKGLWDTVAVCVSPYLLLWLALFISAAQSGYQLHSMTGFSFAYISFSLCLYLLFSIWWVFCIFAFYFMWQPAPLSLFTNREGVLCSL